MNGKSEEKNFFLQFHRRENKYRRKNVFTVKKMRKKNSNGFSRACTSTNRYRLRFLVVFLAFNSGFTGFQGHVTKAHRHAITSF